MLRALVVATTLAIPSIAAAGPYGSLGIGTTGANDCGGTTSTNGCGTDSNNGQSFGFQGNGRSWRAAIGYRFAPLAIISLGKFNPSFSVEGGYVNEAVQSAGYPFSAYELYAAGKLNVPISGGFEGFAKLGLQYTSFSMNNSISGFDEGWNSASGAGWLAGAGVEYRLSGIAGMPPILGNCSVWLDFTYNGTSMSKQNYNAVTGNESREIDTDQLTLGLTIGI
jgi:opacity protein-like surface antigen